VWEPELVAHFRQPEIFDPPPGFKEKNFEVPSGRAQDNFNDIQHTPSISARQDKWVNLLMLSMTDSIVGIYSKFHENAAWELGYGHETTIRLGHM
jgi:RNA-dependent RNA polymerase